MGAVSLASSHSDDGFAAPWATMTESFLNLHETGTHLHAIFMHPDAL